MRKTINPHTVFLEMQAAYKKLEKKYPKAEHIGLHVGTGTLSRINITGGVHHPKLGTHGCVVASGADVSEIVSSLHDQLKEFASELQ